MSLYGIIGDLRRENPTPAASRTLDMVVAELGNHNDNLRRALAALDTRPIPTAGKPLLDELRQRAAAEGIDDLDRPPAPEDVHREPIDESQIGIAVLLGGSALIAVGLALGVCVLGLNQILHFLLAVPEFSFDVVSEYDAAELTNAVDQARREAGTRFDFKNTDPTLEHKDKTITVEASTEDRARALMQVLLEKAARRGLSSKLFKAGEPKTVGRGRGQIEIELNAGIDDKVAKDIQKRIREVSPKVQAKIQGDQLRVTSASKDQLQAVITALKEADDIPVPLEFKNYR